MHWSKSSVNSSPLLPMPQAMKNLVMTNFRRASSLKCSTFWPYTTLPISSRYGMSRVTSTCLQGGILLFSSRGWNIDTSQLLTKKR